MSTITAVRARFNVTTIPSPSGTNKQFGFSVSADGDVNGDGLSDILVGTAVAGRAYLFFGSSTFAAGAPAVVFSGASTGFGFTVAQIGDIDNDGLPDIAIGNPINSGRVVYIYKGRRNWPATLTDTQADYVISTDSSYGFSQFGYSIARIGDFTGDGIDDMAVGAPGFNTGIGRVVIIPGKASGFASVSLPDATKRLSSMVTQRWVSQPSGTGYWGWGTSIRSRRERRWSLPGRAPEMEPLRTLVMCMLSTASQVRAAQSRSHRLTAW